ncbi:MAG TPA: NUDIX domain-containing protein [Candidatus Desulfobacillus sp.]|nr:NUDIX domain-containing protein [Candidatus Desulfobacillus sp.]
MKFCPHCASPLVARELAGRVRLACPDAACGHVFWDNPLPVLAALVERAGRVVLARNRAWPEKMFGLVTGFMERDETPEEGVAREVREELGLYPFQRKNEIILAYHIRAEGEIVLNEELAEFRLIAPEKLRPWDAGTGLAVRDWLARRQA